MGKKAKQFKSGDFIFAKVKGYPAWPARVQSYNGRKYFVYFYGTGETANLPANMVFDYEENKAKFLTKPVKRRDFNEGIKQIEVDFVNKTPLEQIIGPLIEAPANDTADDSAINETLDTTAPDTTANDTVADTSATTQNDTAVEDSDDQGALVIDEGKQKPRKSAPKTPAKPTAKIAKTSRAKAVKKDEEAKAVSETPEADADADEAKKDEEMVSRSGRKIRPKRYVDEQTEDNATLPSPLPKKRRAGSTEGAKEKAELAPKADKTSKDDFNNVFLSELEDLKEPFKTVDPEKENILMAYLPTGNYVGIKLFQTRPSSFKNDMAKLQWEKQAASNAITLKMQLERGQILPQSIEAQLIMELNLTDEEKAGLEKERDLEEKKSRVNFLKTEMKLIELDAKIKSCLCLEKADTDLCLKLLDELAELNVRPLMMLKHPACLETVKRMRAYVGNTPSWDLSERESLIFSKQAHRIRKRADLLYADIKALFSPPQGLSFWEYFSERVLQFKRATASLSADELLELVREPLEMTVPTSHTMSAAIEAANIEEPMDKEEKADSIPSKDKDKESDPEPAKQKEKQTPKKKEKASKKETPKKEKAPAKEKATKAKKETIKEAANEKEVNDVEAEKESEKNDKEQNETAEKVETEDTQKDDQTQKEDTEKEDTKKETVSKKKGAAAKAKKASAASKPMLKRQSSRKQVNDAQEQEPDSNDKNVDVEMADAAKETDPSAEVEPKGAEEPKTAEESAPIINGSGDKEDQPEAPAKDADKEVDKQGEKQKKEKDEEPRAKRSRSEVNKKTEAPSRSPARTRKAKV